MNINKQKLKPYADIAHRIKSGEFKNLRTDWMQYLLLSATQAKCLGIDEVSIIEFGVANGNGLLQYCNITNKLTELTGVKFRIFGFDRAEGLPTPVDYRDHPEIWSQGNYKMNFDRLNNSLPKNAELVIGDIKKTLPEFLNRVNVPPIGFISIDVDYYSSTVDSLKVLESDATNYLPSILMYVDDADLLLTVSEWTGEGLAINEFNETHDTRKIVKNTLFYNKFYIAHILDHPVRVGEQKPIIGMDIVLPNFIGGNGC